MRTLDQCYCAACGASFEVPALAICPQCSGRQIRRVVVLEPSDALARHSREEERLRGLIAEQVAWLREQGHDERAAELVAAAWVGLPGRGGHGCADGRFEAGAL